MRYGEIIELGRHRLMCGDATSREDVMKLIGNDTVNLVLTDPPYGIKIFYNRNRIGGRINPTSNPLRKSGSKRVEAREHIPFNDDTRESARKHYEIVREITTHQIIWGGSYFTDFLPVSGGWIFWDKNRHGLDFSDGELAYRSWGNKITRYKQTWNGVCMEGNYKLNARRDKARIHPTQKPVELHMRILEDFSQSDDVILDCFGGSGTTLIACEMTGRKCLMMEISPEYCDVIHERYLKLKEEYPLIA
jgi:DNA modification methylase